MKIDSKLANMIESGDFIVTAECAPGATASAETAGKAMNALGSRPVAVNMADNSHGIALSSLAASAAALKSGIEPVLQMVTRDRNRIALQSDLMGAASLGIRNVLCMSGWHQTLTGCPESANVFDIDSTQFVEMACRMSGQGQLADGTGISGACPLLVGAVANPFMKPLELNLLRLGKKIEAGARFIQTHPVFDIEAFGTWLETANKEGLTNRTAFLAGVYPLESAEEALKLREAYAEYRIPDETIERLKKAGDARKKGLAICAETIGRLKAMKGLRGVHILSGGRESLVPGLVAASGL